MTKAEFSKLKLGDKVVHSFEGAHKDLYGLRGQVNRVEISGFSVCWENKSYDIMYSSTTSFVSLLHYIEPVSIDEII